MGNRLPTWLTKRITSQSALAEMEGQLDRLFLHTVCQSARCPNLVECFSKGTATFLILGDTCTRNCSFCAVRKGTPSPIDPEEPWNIARMVKQLELKHVVITSVTRDDLPDGGAIHFTRTVAAVRQINHGVTIEILIPDFDGSPGALRAIIDSFPEVIGHNVETVPRLYSEVRSKADYHRSLNLLKTVKSINGRILTKSGLMLGLGEELEEVEAVMEDICKVQCDFFTIGQYLAPSIKHHPVVRYVTPQEFEQYNTLANRLSFASVASGPFVRSSYHAREMYQKALTG